MRRHRIIYTSLLLLMTINFAMAQRTFVNTYIENTSVSPKVGTQVGYEFGNRFELGGFYQKEVDLFGSGEAARPRFYEQEFFGIFFAGPIINREKFDLKLNTRIGATNKENFTITPSVVGNYRVFKILQIQGGVGIRSFRPTFQGGFRINI